MGKVRRFLRPAVIATAVVVPLALAGFTATAAHAATPQYANGVAHGAGATASYASGTWMLNSGHGAGGSAQVDLVSPGTATTAPTFTASTQYAGNPRWVIEFHNGDYLFGNPPAGANQSTLSWTLEPAGKAEPDYATALKDAQAGGADNQVTAAFVVLDTGNPDVTVNLTNVTYDGNAVVPQPAAVPHVYNGHVITVNNNRATVGWNESISGWPNPASKCEEVYITGPGFAPLGDYAHAHIGFTCDNSNPMTDTNVGYLTGLQAGHLYALRIIPGTGTYGNHHPIPGAHEAFVDVETTR